MCPTCVGQKFPPTTPPPPLSPPPHPKNNHTVIRRQCCETFQASCNVPSILQRANYPCNVTTSSKCATCDELQEKIRSIASRRAQKVTGPACACVGQSFPPPPPAHLPPHPPSPKIITRSFVDNVVKRFKHLATCQLSCNVATSSKCAIFDKLQEKIWSIASRRAQKVTGHSSEQSIKSVSQAACACVGQKFPTLLPRPPLPTPKIITRSFVDNNVKRFNHLSTCQASCNVPTFLQRHNIF